MRLRLFILDFGLFQVHQNGRIIGIPGYLLQTPGGENILVDAGFPPWYAEDPEKAALEDGLDRFGRILKLGRENFPQAQLALVGLEPKDIHHLVVTHGDIDHIGCIGDFLHATVWVGRAERAMPHPRYFGGRARMSWPTAATYHLVDDDEDIVPGVTLLSTPGHSPGHLSLLLRLESTGPVILAGDAINRVEEVEKNEFKGAWDEALARKSAHRLLDLSASASGWLVYGHDPAQWGTLRKAPQFYD